MSSQVLATAAARPCVWMSAGLISYRLCDRDYACEACPLDAALQGTAVAPPCERRYVRAAEATAAVPADRRYAPGHLWVRAVGGEEAQRCRIGLDAFAVSVMGSVAGVRTGRMGRMLECGDLLFDADVGLGLLGVGAPVGGHVVRINPMVRDHPDEIARDPYGGGWIAEMTGVGALQLRRLASWEAARERMRADVTRFRRAVAMRLFCDQGGGEIGWLAMGQRLTDLRQLLGPTGYLELVASFVH
jgi:glycine cleavage system H protein